MLLITTNQMKKYLYTANIKGMHMECTNIPQLAKAINDAYDFPIVTPNKLYNYFIRPHVTKTDKLHSLHLERHLAATSESGVPDHNPASS